VGRCRKTYCDAQTLILLGVIVRDDPGPLAGVAAVGHAEGNYRIGDEVVPGSNAFTAFSKTTVTVLTKDPKAACILPVRIWSWNGPQVPTGAERLLALITSWQGSSISEQVVDAVCTRSGP